MREYLIPVVERVFNELKGHVNKDSLSQVFLFFVAMVKDNLRQVRILPNQHPHRRVKDLVDHIFCEASVWALEPELQRCSYQDGSLKTRVAKYLQLC